MLNASSPCRHDAMMDDDLRGRFDFSRPYDMALLDCGERRYGTRDDGGRGDAEKWDGKGDEEDREPCDLVGFDVRHDEALLDNEAADRILRDTYGILLYQEQALMLQEAGFPVDTPFKDLALKGHFVARTMLAVEAIWPRRMKTSLR